MTDDDPYDDEELAEASLLASALERRSRGALFLDAAFDDPDAMTAQVGDALDAANMIAAARLSGLAEDRVDSIFRIAQARIQAQRRRRRRLLVIGASAGSLAAATVAMLMVSSHVAKQALAPTASTTEPVATTPGPLGTTATNAFDAARATLDTAQLAWLNDPSSELTAQLAGSLTKYRAVQLETLRRRYGR